MSEARPGTVATIDLGTNSALLLVARSDGGRLVPVEERAEITRLGRGVDATRRLAPERVEATLEVLRVYVDLASTCGATRIRAVGTSALRDAVNAGDFLAPAEAILGSPVEVISGEREATLTFRGATEGLDLSGEVCVFDIGGGSTEIVVGEGARIHQVVSLDVGSVRLFERHLTGDPPAPAELAAATADAARVLASSPVRPRAPLVGIAGTITTLAAIRDAVDPYDPARIHGARLTRGDVADLIGRLGALPLSAREAVPGLDPRRADVIVAGALLTACILDAAGADCLTVSHGGVRAGLAAELLEGLEGAER